MKLVSTLAVSAALALGAAEASAAQSKKQAAAPAATAPQERKYNVSKEASGPVRALHVAVNAKNHAEYPALLAAAQAAAKTGDDHYYIAKLRLQHALDTNNAAAQAAAVEAILATGKADAAETSRLTFALGQLATAAGNHQAAEAAYGRLIASEPNNLDVVVNLIRTKLELKKDAEALPLLQRAISMNKAAGKRGEEAWYRKALEIADKQRNRPLALQLSREVLSLYPTETNLRNAVIVYRNGASLDAETAIDMLRLMRATKTLSGPSAYLELAQLLEQDRMFGEAKATLEDGNRLGLGGAGASLMAQLNRQIAAQRAELPSLERDARAAANGRLAMTAARGYFGYGDYAKAADLYRVAITKGGIDANAANTRLGIALALAGQKAEAEAAFRAVTGARADLAALWLAWLAQRG